MNHGPAWKTFILPNLAYGLAVWVAYYEGVTAVMWLVSGFAWFMCLAYMTCLSSKSACVASALRGNPAPNWLINLFDVSIGAALLAANAHWTAAAWIISAILMHAVAWRGAVLLSESDRQVRS